MSTQPDFGANEWLVYEMHQQFLKDPATVPPVWQEFLSDYRPDDAAPDSSGATGPAAAERAAPAAPAPAPRTGARETSARQGRAQQVRTREGRPCRAGTRRGGEAG